MPDCDLKMQFSNELEVIAEYSEKTAGYAKHLIDIDAQTVDVIMNEDFGTISDDLGRFKESAQVLRASVGKKRNEYIKELDRKEMTLRELEKGIKDYDPKLILLRDEIKRELSMKYGRTSMCISFLISWKSGMSAGVMQSRLICIPRNSILLSSPGIL